MISRYRSLTKSHRAPPPWKLSGWNRWQSRFGLLTMLLTARLSPSTVRCSTARSVRLAQLTGCHAHSASASRGTMQPRCFRPLLICSGQLRTAPASGGWPGTPPVPEPRRCLRHVAGGVTPEAGCQWAVHALMLPLIDGVRLEGWTSQLHPLREGPEGRGTPWLAGHDAAAHGAHHIRSGWRMYKTHNIARTSRAARVAAASARRTPGLLSAPDDPSAGGTSPSRSLPYSRYRVAAGD